MKAAIIQRARALGFDDCRCTTAQPPASAPEFNAWLAEGRQGEMAWLQRNAPKRVDPQHVLPGAKSIITLAISYDHEPPISGLQDQQLAENAIASTGPPSNVASPSLSPKERAGVRGKATSASQTDPQTHVAQSPSPPQGEREGERRPSASPSHSFSAQSHGDSPTGIIARYARYADYHDILVEPLKALTQFVNELGGADTRSLWYVDTGPFLERDLAQRAGLGFVGKHTNLISRRLGNWIFLAEIITTLELAPDASEKNRCGTCTRCLTACPTAAITAPFQLDARRCISYLTIELKGAIPVEFRAAIGNRIYGCDDCLAACPWNRFAQSGRLMQSHARGDLQQPALLELLALDDAAFKQRFAGTPMLRTKRRGILRNVCVALGNVGDASALPALARAAADPEPLIAEHARWAITQIEQRSGFPAVRPHGS